MNLLALPAFADNYIWMLHDGRQALVVDPGESGPVERALDALGLMLAGILVTHHRADHVGRLSALRPRLQGPVFGPAREDIPQPYALLNGGDPAELLANTVEPRNRALQDYTAQCEALRAQGLATVPSSIERERQINPFMRCAQPDVVQAAMHQGAEINSETDVLAALRQWKNNFR
jgi:glyoxylase-like metal-dependent hydrolase (beta-lactamase superfamily II)